MTFDRTIKMYDESFSPNKLDEIAASGVSHVGKFLTAKHHDSYRLQMQEIRALKVKRVLEIGLGEGFMASYMRTLGMVYDTLDISQHSDPTLLGRLEDLDVQTFQRRYHCVCAFQMLEHFPYERFVPNLQKMAALSREYVYISLPYSCIGFKFTLSFSIDHNKRWRKTFSFHWPPNKPNKKYREQYVREYPYAVHYWEIGRQGFPWKRVKADIESAGLDIVKMFHAENMFHFFVLARKKVPSAIPPTP